MSGIFDFIHYDFLVRAFIGFFLLSLLSGIISPFIHVKRLAFFGEATGHATLLGPIVGIGLLGLNEIYLLLPFSLLLTLFLIWPFASMTVPKSEQSLKLPPDSLIGIFLAATLSGGVILHHFISTKLNTNLGNLESLLFGNVLFITNGEIIYLGLLTLLTYLIFIKAFKKWVFFVYDPQGFQIAGFNGRFFHYLFIFLLTLIIVSTVKIAGTILMNAVLLIPGAFGLTYASKKNMKIVILTSIIFAVITGLLGPILGNFFDLPLSATFAFTQCFLLLIFLGMVQLRKGHKFK